MVAKGKGEHAGNPLLVVENGTTLAADKSEQYKIVGATSLNELKGGAKDVAKGKVSVAKGGAKDVAKGEVKGEVKGGAKDVVKGEAKDVAKGEVSGVTKGGAKGAAKVVEVNERSAERGSDSETTTTSALPGAPVVPVSIAPSTCI